MKTKRRQPIFAEEWQLAVLRKLQTESRRPTEEQRLAAVAETGLDEKWVKNWFTRQKSKAAARNRKNQVFLQQENVRARSANPILPPVTTLSLQLCDPPAADEPRRTSHDLPSYRSASEPIEPACVPGRSNGQVSCTNATHRTDSPHSSQSIADAHALPRCERSFSSTSMPSNDSFTIRTSASHAITMPTYSRDSLCNRYPDFSQFFHPQVHERFRSSESLPPVNGQSLLVRLLASGDTDSHVPAHLRGLLASHHFDRVPAGQGLSTALQDPPYPVAFAVRLADVELLGQRLVIPPRPATNDVSVSSTARFERFM
ncbi:hypothetical protein BS17DRAFT_881722 [Gyrodon lividus]|nr:hypothetical protein BS17DRAFT_881722 [Gyrodon lividus]